MVRVLEMEVVSVELGLVFRRRHHHQIALPCLKIRHRYQPSSVHLHQTQSLHHQRAEHQALALCCKAS